MTDLGLMFLGGASGITGVLIGQWLSIRRHRDLKPAKGSETSRTWSFDATTFAVDRLESYRGEPRVVLRLEEDKESFFNVRLTTDMARRFAEALVDCAGPSSLQPGKAPGDRQNG